VDCTRYIEKAMELVRAPERGERSGSASVVCAAAPTMSATGGMIRLVRSYWVSHLENEIDAAHLTMIRCEGQEFVKGERKTGFLEVSSSVIVVETRLYAHKK
jgi:hypothetical protein